MPFDEPTVRLSAFVIVLAVMAGLETVLPRRKRLLPRLTRSLTNVSMVAAGTLLARLIIFGAGLLAVPVAGVAAALLAEQHGWGLLHWVSVPEWTSVVFVIVVLDFAIWFQHVATHRVPLLWRVHRVHHADRDLDATSGLRFHPVETALSMLYRIPWVLALGAPPVAVVLFEIILNAGAVFNHANVALPLWLDRLLRAVIVTPDMHRVHHSVHGHEHNANFGFSLSIWDRLFSTYTDQPSDGHAGMTIGLEEFQTAKPARLDWSLALPFWQKHP